MNTFIAWLDTEKGKRFTYEVKSFLITFGSVFALLITPRLIWAAEYDNYDIEFLNTFLSGILVAGIRSLFITILRVIGVDYRVDTSKYLK